METGDPVARSRPGPDAGRDDPVGRCQSATGTARRTDRERLVGRSQRVGQDGVVWIQVRQQLHPSYARFHVVAASQGLGGSLS